MSRVYQIGLLALAAGLLPAAATAQSTGATGPTEPPITTLPAIEVVGTSPLLGSGIDRDKVPANSRTLSDRDLLRDGQPDLAGTLDQRLSSISVNGVQNTPFQPDVQYRGFDASPLLGTPQGLAVYQNGVRINEAFGDTVNWDLVPDFAVRRISLISANPVFGLNALGGALALEMKNGFNFQGSEAVISGGSFGRRESGVEYGVQSGDFGAYIGARALFEDGWRQHSPSSIHQLYADLGAEAEQVSAHVSFAGASNLINAIGPTPVELLAQDRSAIYTTPQATRNDLGFLTLSGAYKPSTTLRFDGNLYYRHYDQRIRNGNTSDAQPCDPVPPNAGLLCFGDGATPLLTTAGTVSADVLHGGTPGQIDRTATDADGLGGSLQLTHTAALFDHGNHFVAGVSLDHGSVNYRTTSELGIILPNTALLVSGTGFIIDDPQGDLAPVNLDTTNSYYGIYATDTFDVTDRLAVTLSGRYNLALIRLTDVGGTSLNGNHRFSRVNPAAGATYKIMSELTAYAGYSEANRAPTPGELACADPARPCIIDNFLVSDPNLKQVVARTYEAGLRGSFPAFAETGRVAWTFSVFRTDSADDIFSLPSTISGFGFFQNVGSTRRQGIETGIAYRSERWTTYADYTLLDATFRSTIVLSSPNNPFADSNGTITVKPGDHLPSLPQHRLKLGADYRVTEKWKIGGDLVVASGQYLRGDESNQNPQIPGYAVVNLHSSYEINEHLEVFGLVQNLFDAQYETFGTLFNTSQVSFLNLSNPRSLSPAPPLSAWVGVRARF
jgi:iron complex outermembrane recepter protein